MKKESKESPHSTYKQFSQRLKALKEPVGTMMYLVIGTGIVVAFGLIAWHVLGK